MPKAGQTPCERLPIEDRLPIRQWAVTTGGEGSVGSVQDPARQAPGAFFAQVFVGANAAHQARLAQLGDQVVFGAGFAVAL